VGPAAWEDLTRAGVAVSLRHQQTFPQHGTCQAEVPTELEEAFVRALIVEDEVFLAEALQAGLRQESIAADIALDGDDAIERVSVNDYDVVVLDRDIPSSPGSTRRCGC
jgi:PleD family two-component response regulator